MSNDTTKPNQIVQPTEDIATGNNAAAAIINQLIRAAAEADAGSDVNWDKADPEIEYLGKAITLPAEPGNMPTEEAISTLKRKLADENTETNVHEIIDAFPLEGAVAFLAAMKETYGWASPVPKMTFFGPVPPDMISVEVNPGKYIQIPWGNFKLPGIENDIGFSTTWKDNQQVFVVVGKVRKKERKVLLELAARARQILIENSIYRGKALNIKVNNDGQLDMATPPEFMDVANVNPDELILNADVAAQIKTNIYGPIMHTDRVRKAGIPLKRGILLEGKYGVGKTMATLCTAKICVDHGWTFINIDRAKSLKEALLFAQRYQPAVVFCEDIDRAMGTRDEDANDLLNTIDGIISKSSEVMVVLTTNHVEKIEKAMLRPGRLDAVITVSPPNADSVVRLINLYSRGLLAEGESLDIVGNELAGNIPAVVREVVERSKLSMISNGREELTEEDLLTSARGMQAHLALLENKQPAPNADENLGLAIKRSISEVLVGPTGGPNGAEIEDALIGMNGNMQRAFRKIIGELGVTTEAMEGAAKKLDEVKSITTDMAKVTDKVERDTKTIKQAVS